MTCHTRSCQQTCLAGGCTLKCLGESCKQVCKKGNCLLKCPKNATMCKQNCGQFSDCEKEYQQSQTALTTQTEGPTNETHTTEAPTTEAPTTEAPAREAATTDAPTTEVSATECDDVEDGLCKQSCTGGGCTLECFNSDKYHSCEQSCTGKYSPVSLSLSF